MRRNTNRMIGTILLMGLAGLMAAIPIPAQAADRLDRTVLPIPEPKRPPITEFDARKATIQYEFASDGPGMGKGGIGTISVNGQKVAEGRIEHAQCCVFSADEGADVGTDDGTPVSEDYKAGNNKFTGTIYKVMIELKEMKAENAEVEQQAVREAHARKQLAD